MKKTLNQVLAVNLVRGDRRVIAAGPITKQPGTKAFRLVMVCTTSQIIVYDEYFNCNLNVPYHDLSIECSTVDSHFGSGDYFDLDEVHLATKRFAERIAQSAGCIESIYRDAKPVIDEVALPVG